MKLLVATKETQGQRKNDFSHVPEGEIVTMPAFECDGGTVDDQCGCKRSMVGLESGSATTTMKVAELPLTTDELRQKIFASYEHGEWTKLMSDEELQPIIEGDVEMLLHAADIFTVGMIVERRGKTLRERRTPEQKERKTVSTEAVAGFMQTGLHEGHWRKADGTIDIAKMAGAAAIQYNLPTKKGSPIFKLASFVALKWVKEGSQS